MFTHDLLIGAIIFISTLSLLDGIQIGFWEFEQSSIPKFAQIKSRNPNFKKPKTPMNKVIINQPLTLEAWQEDPNLPPVGIPINKDRPIGYALLRVTFENKTMHTITLHLQKIEVVAAGNQNKLISLPPVDLTLHPLEISPQQYRLTKKEGYGNIKQIKGILVYKLDGQNHTLSSQAVNIN